jgi:hypothetical protein
MMELEAQAAMVNESASLLAFVDGEVLGVPVDPAQVLVLQALVGLDPGTFMMDDVDGDGEEDDPILVVGDMFRPGGGGGGGDGGGTGGDGGQDMFNPDNGTGGGGSSEPPQDPTQDCTDREAIKAKDAILGRNDDDWKEHTVITYRAADGTIRSSPVIPGDWGQIPVTAIRQWLNDNGVSFSQIRGWTHNHDPFHYGEGGEWGDLNSYLSGGNSTVDGSDWAAADWFVANGVDPATFSMYVIDPQGHEMREFHYRDKAFWAGLNADQRKAGIGLPDPLVPDGSTCG